MIPAITIQFDEGLEPVALEIQADTQEVEALLREILDRLTPLLMRPEENEIGNS